MDNKKELKEQLSKKVTVDQVFDAVFSRYQQTLPDIKTALDKAMNIPDKYQYPDLQFTKNPSLKITKI